MNRFVTRLIVLLILVAQTHIARADLSKGMVLVVERPSSGVSNPLFVYYLSENKAVQITANDVQGASFSPDYTQVTFIRGGRLEICGIDGSGYHQIHTIEDKTKYASEAFWCKDGYIYYSYNSKDFRRIKPDGSGAEIAYVSSENALDHASVDERGRYYAIVADAGVGGEGGPNRIILYDAREKKEVFKYATCGGRISDDGSTLCYFDMPGTDAHFNLVLKATPEFTTDGMVDAPFSKYHLKLGHLYEAHPTVTFPWYMGSTRFCRENSARYYGCTHKEGGGAADGSALYDMETEELKELGDWRLNDFVIGIEKRSAEQPALTVTPMGIRFGPDEPDVTISVSVTSPIGKDLAGLSVVSKPDWLTVSIGGTGDSRTLDNTLIQASVPAHTEDLKDTVELSLTDGPRVSYLVTVAAVVTNAVELLSPVGGEEYHPGDTVRIEWSIDCPRAADAVVKVSLDDGENWSVINPGASIPCTQTSMQWVVPDSIAGKSTISDNVLFTVHDYDDVYESTIEQPVRVTAGMPVSERQPGPSHSRTLGLHRRGPDMAISGLDSRYPATVLVMTAEGRTVKRVSVRGGVESILLPVNQLGAGTWIITARQEGKTQSVLYTLNQ